MSKKVGFIAAISVLIIAIVMGILMIFSKKNISKFYLDDKFYNEGNYIAISAKELDNLDDKNYVIFTYNNYCQFSIPCEDIFKEYMKDNKIDFLYIPYDEFKNTSFHKTVKYAPSIIIVKDNKIVDYLNSEKDEDIIKYQDTKEFASWINQYILLKDN